MAYYPDLTPYSYFETPSAAHGHLNVGWLSEDVPFEAEPPCDKVLHLLWQFTRISVMETRGRHCCDFCGDAFIDETCGDLELKLGIAEIRVFSPSGEIYAAPNLLYHYVKKHHYKLPQAFVQALIHGPKPMESLYYDLLETYDSHWNSTWRSNTDPRNYRRKTSPLLPNYTEELRKRYQFIDDKLVLRPGHEPMTLIGTLEPSPRPPTFQESPPPPQT